MFKVFFTIISILLFTSCAMRTIPADLEGKWEKVGYGQVLLDGTEYIDDVHNKTCPNDSYEFLGNKKHIVKTFTQVDSKCIADYIDTRNFELEDNKIIVNNGEYIYSIEELNPEYLKLYLNQHEFSDTESEHNTTTFIYTFIKSKKLK